MTFKLALFASMAAATGLFVSAHDGLDPALDPAVSPDCGIERLDDETGFLLTAWSELAQPGSWSLLVTQSTGGGGFDIMQSGDLDPREGHDPVLSSIDVEAGYSVSARLTLWDVNGMAICSDRLEV
ncbi:MAG: hypothetical protein NXI03_07880 [Alphaproteobacteria bacterium]|mgnify:CR=1 FL=1|jgi:hypothetical protein|uniref:curli-like amyloid fiber formation chaperone CsgH n=1 Tax=Maricaulis alexandrii TaxID=2570354 RepID=UPI00110921E0|nr:curli-like amyloid fiber formation chaperone CsgH [Maricaulis alexandrii]MCR9267476.1 hypothetical protein [Alphaproteobacteria bacterium]